MALEQIYVPSAKIQEILDGINPTAPAGFAGQMVLDYVKVRHAIAVGLGLIDPKQPYGAELFDALCRLTVTVAIEAVCLRLKDEQAVEVLLIQRRADDSAYPGEWHCPGSAQRPGESVDDVFTRLSRGEFWAGIRSKTFVEDFSNPHEARGHFESKIFLCDVAPGAKGTWFPVSALPEKTVDHHRDSVIPAAVKAFLLRERRLQASQSAMRLMGDVERDLDQGGFPASELLARLSTAVGLMKQAAEEEK